MKDEKMGDLLKYLLWAEVRGTPEKHDDYAIGDKNLANKAYGPFQIRQPYMDDVNEFCGTSHKAEDCLGNYELSAWAVSQYMNRYATRAHLGHTPTIEDMCRLHNGGPNGFKSMHTDAYWHSIKFYFNLV